MHHQKEALRQILADIQQAKAGDREALERAESQLIALLSEDVRTDISQVTALGARDPGASSGIEEQIVHSPVGKTSLTQATQVFGEASVETAASAPSVAVPVEAASDSAELRRLLIEKVAAVGIAFVHTRWTGGEQVQGGFDIIPSMNSPIVDQIKGIVSSGPSKFLQLPSTHTGKKPGCIACLVTYPCNLPMRGYGKRDSLDENPAWMVYLGIRGSRGQYKDSTTGPARDGNVGDFCVILPASQQKEFALAAATDPTIVIDAALAMIPEEMRTRLILPKQIDVIDLGEVENIRSGTEWEQRRAAWKKATDGQLSVRTVPLEEYKNLGVNIYDSEAKKS